MLHVIFSPLSISMEISLKLKESFRDYIISARKIG